MTPLFLFNLAPVPRLPSLPPSALQATDYISTRPVSFIMPPDDLVERYIRFAQDNRHTRTSDLEEDAVLSSSSSSVAASTSFDPHAVSQTEAQSYYYGLASCPTLLYRTGKPWSLPKGPEAQRRRKELREVFNHPIVKLWNDGLAWEVVRIMDAHRVHFTTLDVVRFKTIDFEEPPWGEEESEEKEDAWLRPVPIWVGPVTIWVGVLPESTTATTAHNAAEEVLTLLAQHQIVDVDVDFRESHYRRLVGPRLLSPVDETDPLVGVASSFTPVLGLRISTRARMDAEGTMGLYLNDGNGGLLGLTCRHVLLDSENGNMEYVYHPSEPARKVVLLGHKAYTELVNEVKFKIAVHGIVGKRWKQKIAALEEREKVDNPADAAKATSTRMKTQVLLDETTMTMEALEKFLIQAGTDWKRLEDRVLGHIVRSPPISLGVGQQRYTEDWGLFSIDRSKLGDGFKGNVIDLGNKLSPEAFTVKCYTRGDADWSFEFPEDRLLPLRGTITEELMRLPDMRGSDGEPCLLVIKRGNGTATTLGRANGAFSIVRDYAQDVPSNQTSMEWAVLNYDCDSEAFSGPGDSGSIIADTRGRIGGMLTGGAGARAKSSDITYATPFEWLLQRIKAGGFPDANLDVM